MNEKEVAREIRTVLDDVERLAHIVEIQAGRETTHVEMPISVLEEWERKLEERDPRAAGLDPFSEILTWLIEEIEEEFIELGGVEGCDIFKIFETGGDRPNSHEFKRLSRDKLARICQKALKPGHVQWAFEELLRQAKERG